MTPAPLANKICPVSEDQTNGGLSIAICEDRTCTVIWLETPAAQEGPVKVPGLGLSPAGAFAAWLGDVSYESIQRQYPDIHTPRDDWEMVSIPVPPVPYEADFVRGAA